MTFPRKLGLLLLITAIGAAVGYEAGLALPSLRWFFSFAAEPVTWFGEARPIKNWIGHAICLGLALAGLLMIVFGGGFQWNPLTLRKFSRFRSIGRGWLSFRILVILLFVALLDQVLVGKRALAVKHDGHWVFPAFVQKIFTEREFGGSDDQETNYRELHEKFSKEGGGNRVILAPIPWDPTFDSDDVVQRPLVETDGKLYRPGETEPYNGQAVKFRAEAADEKVVVSRFRKGVRDGNALLYGTGQEFLGREVWKQGVRESTTAPEGTAELPTGQWIEEIFPPAPPTMKARHYLGTDSKGWDIAAQMFGGLQVIFKASVFYLVLTYGIGIILGGLSGYFGGWFDLILQRVIEVLSNVPFLLVVMIITANLGRDNIQLANILLIYCFFSWMYVATYLRTSTYKEKARDYVAAARVQGAGTIRVIFRHILPNALSPIVTLLPFSVAGLTTSLTAMDFLGFGLPDRYPSWGRVLDDGTSNLTSPWIVTSVFVVMVGLLILVTFVGEAIREAFDPKKFTTYR
ncbi:ABC transporter permease subunit [Luteolibacter ambystomatis]|uniref:ABC transporter permease subunit n=1 Tax=Luteolibacter ambystomatis TaxID=2824561 RepID=A0A975IZH0_9BACT|nr:ABC transporter permease subunit [Luteolibacter ambystomatis]QUE49680.1 ABC transporter permease subunit [Luteolibacter ambystomatis]